MILCSPQLGISPDSGLGGEVHDREMIKALDDLGVETLIILPWGKKYPLLKHARIYFLPVPFVYPPWIFNILILPYLFYLHNKYKFKILRVHSPNFVGFGALVFKFFNPKIKIVATYHHLDDKLNFFGNFLLKRFDVVTTVSEATRKELGTGVVIPNGVDLKYKPLPKNTELSEKFGLNEKKVLVYLGRLITRKNIPFLFEVIRKLPTDYVLLIGGSGPLDRPLKKTAPDRVIFAGLVPEKDKVDFYNLADVFVYPSRIEGFGLSVIEAMACGKAVVVSDIAAFKEICEGQEGCVLVSLDENKWVKTIVAVGKKKVRFTTRKYSWNKSAEKYLELVSK